MELKRLDSVPINAKLGGSNSLFGQWKPWLPQARRISLGFLAMFVISFVAGRRIESPVRVPEPQLPATIEKQATAEAQFALAMLQPTRAAAWRAVISNFSESPLADLSRLRLGIALMSGAVPDTEMALAEFRQITDASSLGPEKKYLKLLGLIGQLWVLEKRPRSDETDRVVGEIEAVVEGYADADELDNALNKGPQELKWFFERSQLGMVPGSGFNFGVPESRPADRGNFRPDPG